MGHLIWASKNYGMGVPQDYKEALRCFKKARDSFAFYPGYLYETGSGVRQDYGKAVDYYRKYIKSREDGPWEGYYRLGWLTLNGLGVNQDENAASELFFQALGALVGQSPFIAAAISEATGGVDADMRRPDTATEQANLAKARQFATQGDAEAEFALGLAYSGGRGVPSNQGEAIMWWRKAALDGHEGAMFNVGVSYLRGEFMGGVEIDPQKAVMWLKKAEEAGCARATYVLGWMRLRGIKTKDDIGKPKRPLLFGSHASSRGGGARAEAKAGREMIQRAADAGLNEAQAMLAVVYALGMDVPPNMQLSHEWWLKYLDTNQKLNQLGIDEYVNPPTALGTP